MRNRLCEPKSYTFRVAPNEERTLQQNRMLCSYYIWLRTKFATKWHIVRVATSYDGKTNFATNLHTVWVATTFNEKNNFVTEIAYYQHQLLCFTAVHNSSPVALRDFRISWKVVGNSNTFWIQTYYSFHIFHLLYSREVEIFGHRYSILTSHMTNFHKP